MSVPFQAHRPLGIVLIAVLVIALPACRRDERQGPFTITPRRGDFIITVEGRGHLEPEAEMVAAVPPQLMGSIEYIIDEGTNVRPGDVLFKISTQRIERAARHFRLQAGRQKISYEKNVVKHEQESAQRTEELTAAAVRLETARAKEVFLARAADPLAVEKARLELASATRSIEYLSRRLETRRSLADRGYASRLELLQTEDEFDRAILKKTKAETVLTRYRLGKTAKERERLRRTTARLQVNLDEIISRNMRQQRIDTLAAERERLNVESLEAAAKQRMDIMQRATVTATTTGSTVYVDLKQMGLGRPTKGMSVWQGMQIMKVADLTNLKAVVRVAAHDIERVSVGQRAEVRFPALPELCCPATVTRVGRVAIEDTMGGKSDAKQFEVSLRLDEELPALRPNITAVVTIVGETLRDVLRLPTHAVQRDGANWYVTVVEATGARKQIVRVRAVGSDFSYLECPPDEDAERWPVALCAGVAQ